MTAKNFRRHIEEIVKLILQDSDAVLIEGPRQCGKTSLVREIAKELEYKYYDFDDSSVRDIAQIDPQEFVKALPAKAALDEAQKVRNIFHAIKMSIDKDRTRVAGRFLLTGSVNLVGMPELNESLAGRMATISLHPLSQSEIAGDATPQFIRNLFKGDLVTSLDISPDDKLAERIAGGGYPVALRRSDKRRWYEGYIRSIITRDVPDLYSPVYPDDLSKLLTYASINTAQLMNIETLTNSLGLNRRTTEKYISLLQNLFLIYRLPAWSKNVTKRLVRRPKLHVSDTGVACAIMRLSASNLRTNLKQFGALFETFVLQELRRQATWESDEYHFCHYRDKDKYEVDIVIERGINSLIGVEVKAAGTVRDVDFKGLRKLKRIADGKFKAGVVIYTGTNLYKFEDGMYVVPVQTLYGKGG